MHRFPKYFSVVIFLFISFEFKPSPRIIGSVSCWQPEKRVWALCSGCKYTRLSSRVSDRCHGDLRTRYKLTDMSYRIPEKCIWIMCPSCVLTNLSCWIPANSARFMCTSYKLRICKSVWISYNGCKSSDDTHSTPGDIQSTFFAHSLFSITNTA